MNKEWSEQNKKVQQLLMKESTYKEGIATLCNLREELFREMLSYRTKLTTQDYAAMPFINHKGYESKTVAYSLYHMFRIEDIVSCTLLEKTPQTFILRDYQQRMHSPIKTTGNELVREEIGEFSSKLVLEQLYQYMKEVFENTNNILQALPYIRLKEKMSNEDKETLKCLQVVSEDENAIWLIDFWCGKTVKGLIQMPFSRHLIMHVEACERIVKRLTAKK